MFTQANDLCDELGDGAGVAVDTYHVWWDPDLKREIARAGKRILAYHVNDWLLPTTDLLLDRARSEPVGKAASDDDDDDD